MMDGVSLSVRSGPHVALGEKVRAEGKGGDRHARRKLHRMT